MLLTVPHTCKVYIFAVFFVVFLNSLFLILIMFLLWLRLSFSMRIFTGIEVVNTDPTYCDTGHNFWKYISFREEN